LAENPRLGGVFSNREIMNGFGGLWGKAKAKRQTLTHRREPRNEKKLPS